MARVRQPAALAGRAGFLAEVRAVRSPFAAAAPRLAGHLAWFPLAASVLAAEPVRRAQRGPVRPLLERDPGWPAPERQFVL